MMEFILKEIEKALDCGLYYLALQATLVLPDICGALGSSNGKSDNEKYKNWYNHNVKDMRTNSMSAEDCYYFRCSCVHQARTQHHKSTYSRIMFIVPNSVFTLCGYTIINDALHININTFCRDMVAAVRTWESALKDTPNFTRNYQKLIKLYPDGILPYISGIPVIT